MTFGSASDNGTLVYSSATSFLTSVAFSTVVSGGTLRAGAVTFGSLTGNQRRATTVVNAGATLDFNDFSSTVTNLQGAGTVLTGANSATVLTVASGNFAGTISGAGQLVKTGSGSLTLTGNDTYTGNTNLNGGTLGVGSNTAIGAGALNMAQRHHLAGGRERVACQCHRARRAATRSTQTATRSRSQAWHRAAVR